MADRLRAAGNVEAEERHELIVDVLVEPAHADGVALVEVVLDQQIERAGALDAEGARGARRAKRRERALGRQPRPGRFARDELLGARRDHSLRDERGNAGMAKRLDRDADPRTEQTARAR